MTICRTESFISPSRGREHAVLLFLGKPTLLLEKELKKYGYRVGFYQVSINLTDLSSFKDRIPPLKKSGIYSLRCNCGDTYIGQNGRMVEKRFKEHNQAYLRGLKMIPHPDYEPQFDSAMAQHCLESGHFFLILSNLLFCIIVIVVLE